MFEDFKAQVQRKQKQANTYVQSVECAAKGFEKFKQKETESGNIILEPLFPECLDSGGVDVSLVSGAEWDLMFWYNQIREHFLKCYPQTREEACKLGVSWCEEDTASVQVNIASAKWDPMGKLFFELMYKLKTVYDKVMVLQNKANAYEKNCLRFYWYITYNTQNKPGSGSFRALLSDETIFEAVEAYFKICRKYDVPVFEEPYHFLNDQRRCEVKLAGDMLRRTTMYSDFEIHISILEEIL